MAEPRILYKDKEIWTIEEYMKRYGIVKKIVDTGSNVNSTANSRFAKTKEH